MQAAFASTPFWPFRPSLPAGPIGPSQEVRMNPVKVNRDNNLIRFFISGQLIKISFCNLVKTSVIILTEIMLFAIFIVDTYNVNK